MAQIHNSRLTISNFSMKLMYLLKIKQIAVIFKKTLDTLWLSNFHG